jgi:hypothetical protein
MNAFRFVNLQIIGTIRRVRTILRRAVQLEFFIVDETRLLMTVEILTICE